MKKQANVILSIVLCFVLLAATTVPAFAALGTVKNLKVSAVTVNSATLKWSKVSGASGYEVQVSTRAGWQSAAVTQKTTAKLTGLRLGTTYRYRVRAYQSGSGVRYGAASEAVSVTPAPTVKKLKASAKTSYSVTLKWSKVSGATGYRLQKYVDKQWVNVLKNTKKTAYTVKKLAPNTNYKFRVCAFKDSVSGEYQTLTVRTNLLEKPTMLRAVNVSDTGLTITWDKVKTAKIYYIYSVGPNTQKKIAQTTSTSYKLTKLKAAKDYMYAVRARTTVNDRNYYSQFSSYLSVRTAPKQASGLIATGTTDSAVNLSFSKVSGAEGYEIWKYNDATLKWDYIGAATTTRYTVGDLSPQTTYRFKIRAYHTANGSKLCGAFSSELKVQTKMAPVSDLKFVGATGTSLTFSWNTISTATGYRVDLREYDEPDSAMRTVNAAPQLVNGKMEGTVTGLKENTSYVVRVRPVFDTVLGTDQFLYATTAPAKVPSVTVKSVSGGISLSWPAVAGAQGYEVQKLVSGANWTSIGDTPECTFADSNVVTDMVYSYRVAAFYKIGDVKYYGEPSDSVSEKPLPPAVSGLAASEISETSFRLTWNSPQTNTDYKITLSENGAVEQTVQPYITVSGGKTTILVERLTAGSTYTVRIYNTVNGTQSMPATLTVTTMPAKVTGVAAHATGADSVSISWTPVNGAAYYEIQQGSATGGSFVTVNNHATVNPCQVSGLQASTTYTFRVRAVNTNESTAQVGVYSDYVTVATNAASADPQSPVAPTGLQAVEASSGSTYSVKLSWNGVNGVSGYRISINKGSKWETLKDVTTTTYTVPELSAGTYQFYVQSYSGSGSTAVYSNPCTPVSLTLGGGTTPTTPTQPDNPSTPATDLPTSSTPIRNITVKLANDGRTYTLNWDDVSGAFYTIQMLDPTTNKWTTVREKLTSARASFECSESKMGVSCTTDGDQATTVGWSAVSGATGYEVRNEMAQNTNEWISKISTSGTSATLRLPPNSKQSLRVSAIGAVRFKIYALNSAGTSASAYSDYTAQNAYISRCDYVYQTPAAPSFTSSASAGVKEAYALMLTQAINNTRIETGTVNMTATTAQKATASALGTSENSNVKKVITCQYKRGTGTATIQTTEDGKTTSSTAFSMLQTIIVPSGGVTYLYDQHNLSTFQKYVSDVSVSQSGGKTVITMKLNAEKVTTKQNMVYHPGLVGSAVTPENLQSVVDESASVTGATATIGASTIKATINGSYTLESLEISNPYSMTVSSLSSITINTDLTYSYTFTR